MTRFGARMGEERAELATGGRWVELRFIAMRKSFTAQEVSG